MSINVRVSNLCDIDWNKKAAICEYTILQQTAGWGRFVSLYYGGTSYPLIAYDSDGGILALLMMCRIGRYPEIYNKRPLINIVKKAVNFFNPCISWIEGPVFCSIGREKEVLTKMLEFTDNFARDNGVRYIKNVSLPIMLNSNSELEDVFTERGYKRHSWATYIVDLRKPLEDIWNSFNVKVRGKLHKAEYMGVSFKECLISDLNAYYLCHVAHAKHKRIVASPRNKFEIMWRVFSSFGGYKIFSAVYQGKDLAFIPLQCFNKRVQTLRNVQSKDVFDKKVPAGDFLIWECIKWAKNNGYWYFDLAGVSPDPAGREIGIRLFKEKWGGQYLEYEVFSKKI
jgi:hypothetical protein